MNVYLLYNNALIHGLRLLSDDIFCSSCFGLQNDILQFVKFINDGNVLTIMRIDTSVREFINK